LARGGAGEEATSDEVCHPSLGGGELQGRGWSSSIALELFSGLRCPEPSAEFLDILADCGANLYLKEAERALGALSEARTT
jgi:hypothetical protein